MLRRQTGMPFDAWGEAADAAEVPEGFDPAKAPAEHEAEDAVEVDAVP